MNSIPTVFKFTSYRFEPEKGRIYFNYEQDFLDGEPIVFSETIILPDEANLDGLPRELINKLLQALHLILGVSYFKFYCAPKVNTPYVLSKKEAVFWNTIYQDGLGEFYFRNELDPKKSPKFAYEKTLRTRTFSLDRNNKCLVALSGGKDSIVAAESLKEQGINVASIFVETNRESELTGSVAKELGVKFIRIQRLLDPKVFQKHKYDGHIPISAVYAFLGIFYAVLYRYQYLIVANEYSSNFGNTKYKDFVVNHQWSKSSEFENIFSNYVDSFISRDVRYFSILRPFYEIRIAESFSRLKRYFPYFSGCNNNFKLISSSAHGLWCGHCPKCIFTFILLSAFISRDELVNIFQKNLYQDEKLLPIFLNVLGFGRMKPFDCVGTFEESCAAFKLGSKRFENDFIVKLILPKINIKESEIKNLFRTQKSPNIPSQFRFSGMENVLILGYGKEGRISEKYIKKEYPHLKIGVADEKVQKDYLDRQKNYDLAIKTPGIRKGLVGIPYTTATNMFFAKINGLGNKIIGITGSKGKSTTASLIYSILKEAGKNVRILGNIGNPMLGALLKPIEKEIIANPPKIEANVPPESPSNPSIIPPDQHATVVKINNGIYHNPIEISPKKGT